MTEDTKPQRLQPKSKSPMADPAPIVAKRPPGRPPQQRQPMSAPSEAQLEAMRPPEERAPIEQAPVAKPKSSRVPFGTRRAKMEVPEREGFTRRWFNDEPGRIGDALRAGYTHVNDDQGRPLEMIVTKSVDKRNGMKALCMEIPNEFYDADFAAKQEALDIVDMQIKSGTHKEQPGDNRYVPPNTIKFGTTRG